MSTTTPTNTDSQATPQRPTPPAEPQQPPPDQPTPPRRPWQAQPGETPKAFIAFLHYLDLGEKATLKAVAAATQATENSIEAFSRRHNWRERSAAWQEHLAEIHWDPPSRSSMRLEKRLDKQGQFRMITAAW